MNHYFYLSYFIQRKNWPAGHIFFPSFTFRKFALRLNPAFKLVLLTIASLAITLQASAQTRKITGKVKDELGVAVIGATVKIKGGNMGTQTDVNGNFNLTVGPKTILAVSAIGYEATEVTVSNIDRVDITLKSKENSLNEVVVTALGIKREKRELTYASQQVNAEQIAASKEAGVLNALDGKVSGVSINTTSGAPGAGSRIVIRGTSSLTGSNEALIVLDGVPINNGTSGGTGSTAPISRLSDIDPSTIESINVLKGSAAAALYGSQATRGVVIITTKAGAANTKPKVNINSQYSFENAILPKMQDKYALGERGVYYDGLTNATKISGSWGPLISDVAAQGKLTYNEDPAKEFFVTGRTVTNTASVSGGTDKTGYFLSFSNLDQSGTVPTTKYGRNAFFAKFNTKITKDLTATFQLNTTLSHAHEIPDGNGLTAPIWTIYGAPRTYNFLPYLDADGNQRIYRTGRNNPYWDLYNIYNNEKMTRLIPVFTLTYTPLKWLTITERLGMDTYSEQNDYYEAPSAQIPTVGLVTQSSSNYRQFNNDLIAEARKKFGDFDVSLLLGSNIQSTYSQTYTLNGNGTSILGFDNVANGSTLTGSQSYSLIRKLGFYAQSNIDYKNFLNLSLTGRYDGTSVLGLDHDFYPYGSASLAFNFGELIKIPAINFAKLRVSYSAVGNDNVGAYATNSVYTAAGSFPYNSVAGFLQSSSLGNPLLKNESTNEGEIGLEMNLLKNRIGFEVSYFDRHHNDLLTSINLPYSTGFTSTTANVGNMTNKGFEALLNLTPVKSKNFTYNITFNWTKIYNKIIKINGTAPTLSNGNTILAVGYSYGQIYTYGYQRAPDGQYLINNNGLPMATSSNVIVGGTQPNYQAGMTNTFKYKSFSLGFMLDFKNGGYILNGDDRYGFAYGTPKVTENRADRVVPGIVASTGLPNTKSVQAEDYYLALNTIYESAVQDATFLKMRYINLGYDLSPKLLKKTPFSAANFTVTCRNAFIYKPHYTGSDPEVNTGGTGNGGLGTSQNTVPTSRSFNFSLNLTF